MKNHHLIRKALLATLVVLIAIVSASAIAHTRWWTLPTKASFSPPITDHATSTPPTPQNVFGERPEAELVKLTAEGFEPAEINRPAGKFLLGVTNRTGLAELSLRLIHESRGPVGGKRLGREMGWHRVLDLPPGHYALTEASHAEWVCRITISPR